MITRRCRKCYQQHEIFYTEFKDGTKHLIMICGKNYIYIPYEAGLDIKFHLNKQETKIANKVEIQTSLF